jgi:hypothetical protein
MQHIDLVFVLRVRTRWHRLLMSSPSGAARVHLQAGRKNLAPHFEFYGNNSLRHFNVPVFAYLFACVLAWYAMVPCGCQLGGAS